MDGATFRGLLARHIQVHDAILGLLHEANVPPEDGELLLLWLAGLSMGQRQAPLSGDPLQVFAQGWCLGACEDPGA